MLECCRALVLGLWLPTLAQTGSSAPNTYRGSTDWGLSSVVSRRGRPQSLGRLTTELSPQSVANRQADSRPRNTSVPSPVPYKGYWLEACYLRARERGRDHGRPIAGIPQMSGGRAGVQSKDADAGSWSHRASSCSSKHTLTGLLGGSTLLLLESGISCAAGSPTLAPLVLEEACHLEALLSG